MIVWREDYNVWYDIKCTNNEYNILNVAYPSGDISTCYRAHRSDDKSGSVFSVKRPRSRVKLDVVFFHHARNDNNICNAIVDIKHVYPILWTSVETGVIAAQTKKRTTLEVNDYDR